MGEDQIVFYSKKDINCQGKLRLIGTVVEFQGESKRSNSEEITAELQVIADDYECIV